MKNCLLLYTEFPPKNTPGVHRSIRFCRNLPQFDWNPIVLTKGMPQDNTPELLSSLPESVIIDRLIDPVQSKRQASASAKPRSTTEADGHRKSNFKSYVKDYLRPFVRLLSETPDKNYKWSRLTMAKGISLAKEHHVQVVFSSGPPHSTHLAALRIAKHCKIPAVIDLRDPWGRKPWRNQENPLGDYFLPWFERHAVKAASHVILNTETSLDDFLKHYPQWSSKFSYIPNGLDSYLVDRISGLNKSPSKSEIPVLLHPGSLYGHRNPVPLLKAIAGLREKGKLIYFRQIGAIDARYNTEALVKELNLESQVSIEPPMEHSRVLQAMRDADALAIIQPDAPFMVPAKIFEMLAFDQPILSVSDSPCTESIVNRAGGACAPSRDVNGIEMAIERILEMLPKTEFMEARVQARQLFDGKRLTGELADIFNRVRL